MRGIKIATVAGLIIAFRRTIVLTAALGMLIFGVVSSKPEVYNDITHYREYMSFDNRGNKGDPKWNKWGMDEEIWPQKITDSMTVADYKMVYYDPWDEQYLGYLVVDYAEDAYADEVKRLKEYYKKMTKVNIPGVE